MKRTGFIYDDIFLKHETPQWHPERKERLVAILSAVKDSGLWDRLQHINPRKAGIEDIERVHTRNYIERIENSNPTYLDPDTYLSKDTFKASLYAAGSFLTAIDLCKEGKLDNAFCAVRPPGHHAEADRAMGFCIFNNIAVGARYAQKLGYKKVFIVDFDVHHGNGTEHIFYEDNTVFYFSSHQYPHYPGTGSDRETGRGDGEGFTYNVPLSAGTGYKEFESIYNTSLPGLIRNFDPDIVLVSAGYDLRVEDPLASLRANDETIRTIVSGIVMSKPGIPYILGLEGGYDLNALGKSVVITLEELLKA